MNFIKHVFTMTHQTELLNSILPERRGGVVSSVVVLPDPEKYKFETQNPGEEVYIMLRSHLITNVGWIVSIIVAAVIPFIVFFLLNEFHIDLSQIVLIKPQYIILVLILWYVLLFTQVLINFLNWFFNIYIMTNQRIIDFDFSAFSYHHISETSLENIEDVTGESVGFLPSMFDYGDILIQTAAEKDEFKFENIPNPNWVRDKIMDLRDFVVNKFKEV